MSASSERRARNMQSDQEELAERIARALPHDGMVEPQPGLHVRRCSRPTARVHGCYAPFFCVIAQGSKALLVGEDIFRYDPAHYVISTIELPMIGQVLEASPERPYLALRLVLDPSVVTSVLVESGLGQPGGDGDVKALDVSALDADLLDATVRLVRLIDTPGAYRALAPLVVREITYRLLAGAQGSRMRHLAICGGHAHRMARAVEKLRVDFDKPLRLQEARRLMLNERVDAAEAGYRVGYHDISHFSREYKRHFGEPPMRDVARLRELAGATTAH